MGSTLRWVDDLENLVASGHGRLLTELIKTEGRKKARKINDRHSTFLGYVDYVYVRFKLAKIHI